MSCFAFACARHDRQVIRHAPGLTRDNLRAAALADRGQRNLGVFAAARLWYAFGTGSGRFRQIRNAWVALTAAIAVCSDAVNLELSRTVALLALPTTVLLDATSSYAYIGVTKNGRISRICTFLTMVVADGQMGLAGPRPASPDQVAEYALARRRLVVKPGLTGRRQIGGPPNLSWEKFVRLELRDV